MKRRVSIHELKRPVSSIDTAKVEDAFKADLPILEAPVQGAVYAHGADWAKKKNHTVVVTIRRDVKPMRVVAVKRTNKERVRNRSSHRSRATSFAISSAIGWNRLMRAMAREKSAGSDAIARQIRAHACACAFARGRSLEGIALDSDLAAGWDARTVESEIRTRLALKR